MIVKQVSRSLVGAMSALVLTLAAVGCGGEEKDKVAGPVCTTPDTEEATNRGWVTKFSGDSVTVAFPEATVGEEYLVMPYALGDIATVRGDDEKTVFNFTVEAAKGSVLGIQPLLDNKFALKGFAGSAASALMSDLELQHAKRSILNRFDSRKSGGQGDDFWQLVRNVDREDARRSENGVESHDTFESVLKASEKNSLTEVRTAKKLSLLDAVCPSGEITIPLLDGKGKGAQGLDITGATVIDGTDFCIVIVDQPTATTADEIKTIAADLIATYKAKVYNNAFAPKDGITFKPVIAVIDFNNAAKWPAAIKNLFGVFSADTTEDAEKPMLYMPTTLAGLTDAATIKNNWYATLAHELQHANMNYFRKYASATKVEEIPALDEGLAHYFEDFFGFGDLGFSTFAGTYLSLWYNEAPMITDGEAGDTNAGRGAAQSLWYYLTSQKGGVDFDDGKPTGYCGVEFLRAAANSTQNGPQGLATAFGGDWTTTVGNFFGALALDGSSSLEVPSRYRTQEIEKDVKNLIGNTSTYGYSFNGYGSMKKDISWDADRQLTALPKVMEDVPYYAPAPFVYKVADVTAELKISRTDGDGAELTETVQNMAVSVIKIK